MAPHENGDPLASIDAQLVAEAASLAPKYRLFWLVVVGTGVISAVGLTLFMWVAWIESGQELSPFSWMSHVDGDAWFNAARTSATFLAVVGVGGAAIVGYRKQQNAELTRTLEQRRHIIAQRAQVTAASQAQTAADQLSLDSQKYELELARQQLERERQDHERERSLRDRNAVIVSQLSSSSATQQSAGLHALVALANDWNAIGNPREMRVCVDLFCGHLRTLSAPLREAEATSLTAGKLECDVLATGASIIRSQFRRRAEWAEYFANGPRLDLSGVFFPEEEFNDLDLRPFTFSNAVLSGASLSRSDISDVMMTKADLRYAFLMSTTMIRTRMWDSDFTNAIMDNADLTSADLSWADLTRADIDGTNFNRADITDCIFHDVKFSRTSKLPSFVSVTGEGTRMPADLKELVAEQNSSAD